jgi:hypothetical protein
MSICNEKGQVLSSSSNGQSSSMPSSAIKDSSDCYIRIRSWQALF